MTAIGELRDPIAFVRGIAKRIRSPRPYWEDLDSAGCVALVEAVRTYRAERGDFCTYATARVRFGILDERRKQNRLKGRSRFQDPATFPEWVPIDACPNWESDYRVSADAQVQRTQGAQERLERLDLGSRVAAAIDTLDEKERLVVSLYYLEDMKMREIGEILEVTETRICQLHASALRHLREALTQGVTAADRRARKQARALCVTDKARRNLIATHAARRARRDAAIQARL